MTLAAFTTPFSRQWLQEHEHRMLPDLWQYAPDAMADDVVVKNVQAQRLLAIARPIPGFGPDHVAPARLSR
jgi:hypothetical protein